MKAFGWLLTEPQRQRFDEALNKFIRDARNALVDQKSITDKAADGESAGGASSSSLSSGALVKASSLAKGVASSLLGEVPESSSKKEAKLRLLAAMRGKAKTT